MYPRRPRRVASECGRVATCCDRTVCVAGSCFVPEPKEVREAYFYGFAGIVFCENRLSRPKLSVGPDPQDGVYKAKLQQFWELVRTAVQNGQPDVLDLLKNDE